MEVKNGQAGVVVDARSKFLAIQAKLKNQADLIAVKKALDEFKLKPVVNADPARVKLNRGDLERLAQCQTFLINGVEKLAKTIAAFDEIGINTSQLQTGLNLVNSYAHELQKTLDYAPNRRLLEFVEQRQKAKAGLNHEV